MDAPLVSADSRNQQRSKIWDISPNLHCSIIGTCLTAAELRQFLLKMGETDARTATDHSLHSRGVLAAGRRDTAGKLLNKVLDKRHEALIKRFSKASTTKDVRTMWLAALEQGDIPGAYWAVLTHPATDRPLVQEVFGEVHMLSHLVGRSNRLDISRLQKLQRELDERDAKVAKQEARLLNAAKERSELLRRIEEMEQTVIRLAARQNSNPGTEDEKSPVTSRLQKLDAEKVRSDVLVARLQESEDKQRQTESRANRLSRQVAELQHELAAVNTVLNVENTPEVPPGASSQALLYVGGRRGLFDRLRTLAERHGYELFIHDGGVEDNISLLPGLVSQTSAALFPVDCISHSAAGLVKRLCQDEQKKFVPLRTASLASFGVRGKTRQLSHPFDLMPP
jgi:hypothetical protein